MGMLSTSMTVLFNGLLPNPLDNYVSNVLKQKET